MSRLLALLVCAGEFMDNYFSKIHQNAIRAARHFHRSELQLMEAIGQVDAKKVFRKLGHANLFNYCVKELNLSEGNTYAFIRVTRKAVEIPEIKKAISEGRLSVSKAKRVLSVISPENQKEWIAKAASLPQQELEREVVRANPKAEKRESVRPISESRVQVQLGLSHEMARKLKQVQDLVSQKMGKAATLEDCLEKMLGEYVEKHDPVEKAKRRRVHSAPLTQAKHEVAERDQNRCTHVDRDGSRCESQRWLDFHHVRPRSEGGADIVANLQLLCRGHHQAAHFVLRTAIKREFACNDMGQMARASSSTWILPIQWRSWGMG